MKRKLRNTQYLTQRKFIYYATINWNNKNYKLKLYKGSFMTSFKYHYSIYKKI